MCLPAVTPSSSGIGGSKGTPRFKIIFHFESKFLSSSKVALWGLQSSATFSSDLYSFIHSAPRELL